MIHRRPSALDNRVFSGETSAINAARTQFHLSTTTDTSEVNYGVRKFRQCLSSAHPMVPSSHVSPSHDSVIYATVEVAISFSLHALS